jgi:hypothetical protein
MMKTLQEVTAGFVGCTDVPMVNFLPELMELYPDAKVVLVTRDPERWWQSFAAFADNKAKNSWTIPIIQLVLLPLPGVRWFPSIARGFDEEYALLH